MKKSLKKDFCLKKVLKMSEKFQDFCCSWIEKLRQNKSEIKPKSYTLEVCVEKHTQKIEAYQVDSLRDLEAS